MGSTADLDHLAMLDFPAVATPSDAAVMSFIVHGGQPGHTGGAALSGRTCSLVPSLCAHIAPVYPYTLTVSSSMAFHSFRFHIKCQSDTTRRRHVELALTLGLLPQRCIRNLKKELD